MDNESFKIDARIEMAIADPCLRNAATVLATRLSIGGAVATVRLGAGRDTVLMAAIASCLVAEPELQSLVVAPGEHEVAGLKAAFDPLGLAIGKSSVTIGREGASVQAPVIIGSLDTIASCVASGTLDPRSFGLVALSNIDTMANAATVAMLRHALGPSSTRRRFVAFCTELGPSHRAVARDIGGSVVELELEAEGERAKSADCLTYTLSVDDKPRLLLGLLASKRSRPVAVFCNLRETAESTAKFLREHGVRTEFVLGNLPRKRAILESVTRGAYEVIVLTDEGAKGLPPGWAAMIVNWDIPLEPELYITRLGYLDTTSDAAFINNFACERYAYGIPMIERVLGHDLKTIKAEESMMVTGSPMQEPRHRAEKERQERQAAPVAERGPARGSDHRRGEESRDHGGQYDGRNVRAIQADIAAITGGKPLRDVASTETAKMPDDTSSKGKKRGRKTRNNGAATASSKTTPLEAGKRGVEPLRRHDEKQASRQQPRRPKGGSGQRLADPYSVSMEERLRLYRERYGEGAPKPAQGGKVSGRKSPSRRDGQSSSSRQVDKGLGAKTGPRSSAGPGLPGRAAISRKTEGSSGNTPATKGLFGSLRNLFGKKED